MKNKKLEAKIEKASAEAPQENNCLTNCEDCGCLIHMDVYNLHKKTYNKGVCGICLGLTQYSREMKNEKIECKNKK